MNETNIKHGYSLMVREARDAILNPGAPECSTWHKFPNPVGAISTKNVLFPIQGAQFWLKMSYFQTRGQDFDQICLIYNPGGTILTKNVILPTPVVWFWPNSS